MRRTDSRFSGDRRKSSGRNDYSSSDEQYYSNRRDFEASYDEFDEYGYEELPRSYRSRRGANRNFSRGKQIFFDIVSLLTVKNLSEMNRRLLPLFFTFLVLTSFVCIKLVWIQIIHHSEYTQEAQDQRTRDITIPAKRGTIYDRQGNVLAKSVEVKTVYVNPKEVVTPYETASIVADTLDLDINSVMEKINKKDKTFVYIEHKIDNGLAEDLMKRLSDSKAEKGIYLLKDSKRVYPYGAVAGQVIGAVNRDGDGLSGLEKYYNDILKGKDGELLIERGRTGQPIAGGIQKNLPAEDGEDIVISLDIEIQQQAEHSVAETVEKWGAISGTAVVMDPRTGEILATCSTPYLDPSHLSSAESESLKLRSVSDAYEPGSTFKPFTAAFGLESGVTSPQKSYVIPSSIKVGDHDVRDITEHGTINLTLREILAQSSNIGMVLLSREIGVESFHQYLDKMHFGDKTGVDFGGESGGIVLPLKKWNGSTLGSNSFGQGISLTPMQMSRGMSAVAHEGLMRVPHFLVSRNGERVEYPEPERVMRAETSRQVAEMMRGVVEEGTGKNGRISGYAVSGKTGTAQRANPNGGGYIKGSNTANFIGFAPTSDPQVLVYVVIEGTSDGFGGTTAGPPFREIMKVAFKRLNIPPSDLKAFNESEEKDRKAQEQEESIREKLIEKNGTSQEKAHSEDKKNKNAQSTKR